jgi:hypothetical protein
VIDPTGGSGSDDSGSGDDSGSDDSDGTSSSIKIQQTETKASFSSTTEFSDVTLYHKRGTEVTENLSMADLKDRPAYTADGTTITIDKSKLKPGNHTYRLKSDKTGSKSSNEVSFEVEGTLLTTYPNPVSQGQATVEFVAGESADVTVTLYNTLGQRVRTLHRGPVDAGDTETADVNAQSLASGVYFVRMRGDGVMATTRMTIVK